MASSSSVTNGLSACENAGFDRNGAPMIPDSWRTENIRDPLRYCRRSPDVGDGWETCMSLMERFDDTALLRAFEHARTELENWMERARAVTGSQDTDAMHDLLFPKSPPLTVAHLATPRLFERGMLSQQTVEEFMQQGKKALILATRMHMQNVLHDQRNGQALLDSDYRVAIALDTGLDPTTLPEWKAFEPVHEKFKQDCQRIENALQGLAQKNGH